MLLNRGISTFKFLSVIVRRPNILALSTTSTLKQASPSTLAKFKKKQSDFQAEDGKPIFLKGGFCDRILYSLTWILCLVGLVNVVLVIYDHSKPPSWKSVC
ncbi:unnamed protein product [Plutella xylostella]|uniref:(diamondback moth) hypothetical protein n=1 Tax=Plutella xylostella TaxID=51655 RepID=A0A8S4G869_PLUXY|nr:unnamed protein product [Plutella xylostella]